MEPDQIPRLNSHLDSPAAQSPYWIHRDPSILPPYLQISPYCGPDGHFRSSGRLVRRRSTACVRKSAGLCRCFLVVREVCYGYDPKWDELLAVPAGGGRQVLAWMVSPDEWPTNIAPPADHVLVKILRNKVAPKIDCMKATELITTHSVKQDENQQVWFLKPCNKMTLSQFDVKKSFTIADMRSYVSRGCSAMNKLKNVKCVLATTNSTVNNMLNSNLVRISVKWLQSHQ